MSGEVSVTPTTVGEVAWDWDEQSGELSTAAGTLSGADSSGFSARVSPTATQFVQTWVAMTEGLEDQASGFGDELRAAITAYLQSDRMASLGLATLGGYLEEGRR